MANPLLRAETTTTINFLISTADIITNKTMGNKLYATGAGTTSSTLETRDNVIKEQIQQLIHAMKITKTTINQKLRNANPLLLSKLFAGLLVYLFNIINQPEDEPARFIYQRYSRISVDDFINIKCSGRLLFTNNGMLFFSSHTNEYHHY